MRYSESWGSINLPILFKVNVALDFLAWLIHVEAALCQDLDDAGRLRIGHTSGRAIDGGCADYFRIATEANMRGCGVERTAEAFFELAAGQQVLNIHFLLHRVRFARRQAEVFVV